MNFKRFSKNNKALCRICLTHSSEMHELEDTFLDDKSDMRSPNLADALEEVMNSKFIKDARFPKHLCHLCKSLLKISYDLKMKFEQSERSLINSLNIFYEVTGEKNDPIILEIVPPKEKPPVEVIAGNQKFDFKDLLIVDEPEESKEDFSGFLNNLGTEISASFVKKKPEIENIYIKYVSYSRNVENCIIEHDNSNTLNSSAVTPTEELQESEDEVETVEINSLIIETPLNKCKSCRQEFGSKKRYLQHIKHCLTEYICNKCSRQFASALKLRVHIRNIHKIIKCKFCSFTTVGKCAMFRHEIKHKGRLFMCDICGKGFYIQFDLDRHKLTHLKQKEHQELCPICGKIYSNLGYHLRLHKGLKEFKCDYCTKAFITPGQLRKHERFHTGEKPFKCIVCEKCFSTSGMLKVHTYVHTGAKPLKCKYCEKRFTKHCNMHAHAKSHSGPFKCSMCSKSFMENRYLQQHWDKKHGSEDLEQQ